jgi:hypothetical protein
MIDHLSEEIKREYPGRPKADEDRVYRLLGIKVKRDSENNSRLEAPNNRLLPSAYVLFDHVKGQRTKITYVSDQVPSTPNSIQPFINIPGRVQFRRANMGEIRITHDNYPMLMEIDKFLWFSPWLDLNATQPWFMRHKFGFIYTRVDRRGKAAMNVAHERDINFAKGRILEMSLEEVSILTAALKLGNVQVMSPPEQVDALLKYYSKPDNARNFKALTEEGELQLRALVKQAQKHQIIRLDDNGVNWIWVKGEHTICHKYPGKGAEESLLLFFATPLGHETEIILRDLVRAAEDHKKAAAKAGNAKPKPATKAKKDTEKKEETPKEDDGEESLVDETKKET